jgi:hypothetical protein
MNKWIKQSYGGEEGSGRWTISNGHTRFDVHPLFDGSGRKNLYPDGVIVSVKEANDYADWILNALNAAAALEKAND